MTFTRKIKEALLAMRIERTYSKDKILELYLNEIYLGLGAYGIAAASLVYFDKSVNELSVSEAAYLAALPKAPSTLHPVRNHDGAIERRNYVIDRLLENGWIKRSEADEGRKDPLKVTNRPNVTHTAAGEYFAEEVFAGETPEVQQFLTRIALLDRIELETCAKLYPEFRASVALPGLVRANVFMTVASDQNVVPVIDGLYLFAVARDGEPELELSVSFVE